MNRSTCTAGATFVTTALALFGTAAGASAYGAYMPSNWDSGSRAGTSTYASACQVFYAHGRTSAGYLWTRGLVGNPACNVSVGLFGGGPFSVSSGGSIISGSAPLGVKWSANGVRSWNATIGWPFNYGHGQMVKITTSIPGFGVSSGEVHDVNNR
ncbi:MAG: hypothetical protein V9E83_13515 [Baekduia sp.]